MSNNSLTRFSVSKESLQSLPALQMTAKSFTQTPGTHSNGILIDSSSFSVELLRHKVKIALKGFEFETPTDEIDFLLRNYEVFKILTDLSSHLRDNFGSDSKLVLELLNEGPNWQTLFINIHSSIDWEKSKIFIDKFFDNMFELFPSVADKININVIPSGI